MAEREAGRLSQERILAAARDVVERDGMDALSMRRLAQELDVWPMSVYRYFRDKDELLDTLAASAAADVAAPRAGASWREQLTVLLRQARSTMSAETASRLPRAFLTPGVLRLPEGGLGILEGAGFSKQDAASAWRALWSYTFGFATFALAPTEAEARRRVRSAVAALPDDEYPALTAAADELAGAFANDAEFERGLERLFDGLERARRPAAPAGRSARTRP
jgi:AcrR family transcriptional regulator